MNIALLILQIIACFSLCLFFYKMFGKVGAVIWSVISIIIANIEAVTIAQFGPYELAMGNVFFGVTYLATDILSEKYGKKAAKSCVTITGLAMIAFSGIIQITLHFIPGVNDFAHDPLNTIFGMVPVISIASVALYFASNFLDVYLFDRIKTATSGRYVWLRNNAATMISCTIQTLAFNYIVYWLAFGIPAVEVLKMAIVMIAAYIFIAACDTPFLYIARKIKPKELF